jgi:hypothetical protein
MLVERGAVCRVVVSAAQSPGRRGTGSSMTHCWRKRDSNSRSSSRTAPLEIILIGIRLFFSARRAAALAGRDREDTQQALLSTPP